MGIQQVVKHRSKNHPPIKIILKLEKKIKFYQSMIEMDNMSNKTYNPKSKIHLIYILEIASAILVMHLDNIVNN